MEFVLEPISVLNIVLCIIIIYLGIWSYTRTRNKVAVYITVAFGLFAASHLITIIGYKDLLENAVILIRIAAYMVIAFALHNTGFEKEIKLR